MSPALSFPDFLTKNPITLLAGAMGTELQRRGYKTKLPLWSAGANLDALDLVKQIHIDYLESGADVSITNTFRTTTRTFAKLGLESQAHIALKNAVSAAKEAQKSFSRRTFVAGSFAPLEDCYEPSLVPDDAALTREHAEHAGWLAEEGVDFLLAETVNALREARAMAQAASSTGLPFIISFVVDAEARLLDGTPVTTAIDETDFSGRLAVGLNCRPVEVIESAFDKLRQSYSGVFCLYPNGFGCPHNELGWHFHENQDSVDSFVEAASRWKDGGAKIIGGCCGTTPEYIKALDNARHAWLKIPVSKSA